MQRRHESANIPIELIRTLVAIAETGSYSAAGNRLSLSQPAITAQVKRLHAILGTTILRKTRQGVELTAQGVEILGFARQYLKANDDLLFAIHGNSEQRPVRIGISSLYAAEFFAACRELGPLPNTVVSVSHSDELDDLFQKRQLDAICSLQLSEAAGVVHSWIEQPVWVRSATFEAQPGARIPVITSPNARSAVPVVQAIERRGLQHRVIATSPDLHARIEAAQAGLGYTALLERLIVPPLVKATETFLPPLDPVRSSIRSHVTDAEQLREITARLTLHKPAGVI